MLIWPITGDFWTPVTPVHHKGAIKQSRSTTYGVKSTQEYFRGH